MRYQKVKYKFINNDTNTERELVDDPKNWENSDRTLKRSTKYFGVYTELSKNLHFVKEEAEFLRNAYAYKDIEADVDLLEYRLHPQNEEWYLHSRGKFDFSDYKSNRLTVNIPFKTGGLNSLIESQLKEKFELERTESINGNTLEELSTTTIAITSRKILLISELEKDSDLLYGTLSERYKPNLNITSNSDEEHIGAVIGQDQTFTPTNLDNATATDFFYFNNDVAKTLSITIDYDMLTSVSGLPNTNFELYLYRYQNNGDGSYTYIEPIYFYQSGGFIANNTWQGTITRDVFLNSSQSLMCLVSVAGGGGSTSSNTSTLRIYKLNITVSEDSIRDDSNTKGVFRHEVGDRLIQIITGEKDRFYSPFYGRTDIGYEETGEYALTAIATGFWIRKFDDKSLNMSLDDYFKTNDAIHNVGYTIQEIDNVEKLVVDDKKYFFQNSTAIFLPSQVTNVNRFPAKELCYSSMDSGYKKGGDYEEAMGLDEYNIATGYTLPLKRIDTEYSKISEDRADKYGCEFARRKPKLNYPEEDTRYDKDNFLFDLKEGNGEAYEERVWQDDYETEPTGVYSPETATNLRLTPFRNNERHQWFYSACLQKQQDEKVRYSNTEGNNQLATKKVDEVERKENGNIDVSDLEKNIFTNQYVTFEAIIDYEINQQIYGTTNINGRDIPNYFFKVEYINEFNVKEYGYIFEIKQKQANLYTFKILKAA